MDRCGSGVYSGLVVCIRDQSRRTSSDTHRNLCTFSPNVAPTLGSLWCDKYSDDLKPVAVAAWNRLRSLTNAVCSTSQRQRPGSCESVVCSRRAGCCRRMKTRSCGHSRTAFILRAACKSNRVCSCKARQARGSYGCSYGSQSSQLKCCVFGAASAACTVYVYTSLELEL